MNPRDTTRDDQLHRGHDPAAYRVSSPIDDDELLETIARLIDADETLALSDGVSTPRIAEALPHHPTTISHRCSELVAVDRLERDWGVGESGPMPGYIPSEDDSDA